MGLLPTLLTKSYKKHSTLWIYAKQSSKSCANISFALASYSPKLKKWDITLFLVLYPIFINF